MSINVGGIGKKLFVDFKFDVSNFSVVTLKFTGPGPSFIRTTPTVLIPDVDDVAPDIGAVQADTYAVYITEGDEFTVAGTWTVCGVYEDLTPKRYPSVKATFTVGDDC